MATDPAALPGLLRSFLDKLGNHALTDPSSIGQLFDQLPKAGDPLPQTPLPDLDALRHPDWWALLVFVLVQIQKQIGNPELWLGVVPPTDEWARTLALNYSPGAKPGQTPPPAVLTVGLALGESKGGTGNLKQGIRIDLAKSFDDKPFGSAALTLTLSGTGNGSWWYAFGSGLSPLLPAGAAASSAQATLSWAPWKLPAAPLLAVNGNPALTAAIALHGADPLYQVDLGAGPFDAHLDFGNSVLGVLASSAVNVSPVHYDPHVQLIPPHSPTFTLGA